MRIQHLLAPLVLVAGTAHASSNQTDTLTPIENGGMPFSVSIELVDWIGDDLPSIQSASYARSGDDLLFIGGRTSGVHGFECDPVANFLPATFNEEIFVLDTVNKHLYRRSMQESDLALSQIAALASTNKLMYHDEGHLIMVGGYGYEEEPPPKGGVWLGCPANPNSRYLTINKLMVVDLETAIAWTKGEETSLAEAIRFIDSPAADPDLFQVTGGQMYAVGDEYWICLGHSYDGGYESGCDCPTPANQVYTKSIRRFSFDPDDPEAQPVFLGETEDPPAWARRRDLNVLPARHAGGRGVVALGGPFTPGVGTWTVPIVVDPGGEMYQPDPDDPDTLKQAFNIYHSAALTLWMESTQENWMLVFGGIGYQVLDGGEMIEDPFFPYSKTALAIRYAPGTALDHSEDDWSIHFPGAEFPEIIDTETGLSYYFGTEMAVMPLIDHDQYLYDYAAIDGPTTVAYLYGGIVSPGQNRSDQDPQPTFASNLIFQVVIDPVPDCPGDIGGTGSVGTDDLLAVAEQWGCTGDCTADVNNDGVVNVADLLIVLRNWGPCP